MELNIGDYVRTKDGIILKIKDIEDIYTTDNIYVGMAIYDADGHFINDVEIIKSSPNIIDLIQEGDLIKLKPTKQIQQVLAINDEEIDLTDYVFYDLKKSKKEFIKRIEWVITQEQIEQMKYKIEG